MIKIGDRVVRGPDWRWDQQDCDILGYPRKGTVVEMTDHFILNVRVEWDTGHNNIYSSKEGDLGVVGLSPIKPLKDYL